MASLANLQRVAEGLSRLAIASLGGTSISAIDTPFRGVPLTYPTF